tara:strand:+ start:198 stop:914 length:717 start_codon:yes stop_codon:yes gene_type:complete
MKLVDRICLSTSQKRKIPARVSAETGFYRLGKGRGEVAFQSSLERGFAQMCDFANEVVTIKWEPHTFVFDDLVDGTERRYTPDYLVELSARDGGCKSLLVEVKPQTVLDRIEASRPPGLHARKHLAAREWCNQQDRIDFMVVSEKWLEAKGWANVRAIMDRQKYRADPRLKQSLAKTGLFPASLGNLVAISKSEGFERGAVISSLLRMCADDHIWFDRALALTDDTVFKFGERRRIFD